MLSNYDLLYENFLMSKKDIYIDSKYYVLYDIFMSEAIDDEFSESIDVYSSFNDELDCYLIDIDSMIQEAVFYSLYYELYDTNQDYTKYDLQVLVLNELVRLYNVMLVHDVDILIKLVSNAVDIIDTLHYELIYYNENYNENYNK